MGAILSREGQRISVKLSAEQDDIGLWLVVDQDGKVEEKEENHSRKRRWRVAGAVKLSDADKALLMECRDLGTADEVADILQLSETQLHRLIRGVKDGVPLKMDPRWITHLHSVAKGKD